MICQRCGRDMEPHEAVDAEGRCDACRPEKPKESIPAEVATLMRRLEAASFKRFALEPIRSALTVQWAAYAHDDGRRCWLFNDGVRVVTQQGGMTMTATYDESATIDRFIDWRPPHTDTNAERPDDDNGPQIVNSISLIRDARERLLTLKPGLPHLSRARSTIHEANDVDSLVIVAANLAMEIDERLTRRKITARQCWFGNDRAEVWLMSDDTVVTLMEVGGKRWRAKNCRDSFNINEPTRQQALDEMIKHLNGALQ